MRSKLPRSFWDWKPMLASNATGYFPYTPATNMLYALDTAVDMLLEIGLVIGVPFIAGITIARIWPRFAERAGKIVSPLAFLALGVIIVIGVATVGATLIVVAPEPPGVILDQVRARFADLPPATRALPAAPSAPASANWR